MRNLFYLMRDEGAGGGEPPKAPPPEPKGDQGGNEQMVPKQRFDEINGELKEIKGQYEKMLAAQKQREEEDLKKREEWKTIAETREKELTASQVENMRLRVAMEKGLPSDLVDRLQGNTLEDISADAEKLLPLIAPEKRKSTVPPLKTGGEHQPVFDLKGKSPKEIREARAAGKI